MTTGIGEIVRRLGEVAGASCTTIFAWALMSNHAHILLASGAMGLAKFMRRLLTGYAVTYNLRHRRHGHLFQDRYKSIVCDGRWTGRGTDSFLGQASLPGAGEDSFTRIAPRP